LNRRLLAAAVEGARGAGGDVTELDLRDHPMPLYDGDLEAEDGLPQNAVVLRELFLAHQGLLLCTPEYNGSLPPLLKNTLDWVSRGPGASADLSPYRGKVVALGAASPGGLGGARVLLHLRTVLGNIGCWVLPRQVTLARAGEAFDASGRLADDGARRRAEGLGADLVEAVRRLSGGAGGGG